LDLFNSIRRLTARLDEAGVKYALIGGMAMAMRGVQRATFDLDFLIMISDLEITRRVLADQGYQSVYQSENVSHFENPTERLARVDLLHAFRGPSLSMLDRAERLSLGESCHLPVLQIEDLIGLKVQAASNDPARALGDWNDIYRLVIQAAETSAPKAFNWLLISDYLDTFDCSSKLAELETLYERHLRN
jgi:hypothetical protein